MAANKPEVLVSPKQRQISSKFHLLHLLYRVDASTGGTFDLAGRRSFSKIQHGRQQTGSTSISETTTYVVEILTATPAFPGRRVHWRHCRRLPTSISPGKQHGRQRTGSTRISETTTDIVEILTATHAFPCRRVHGRHCRRRPTSISPENQHGRQQTGSASILRNYDRYRRYSKGYTCFSG